MRPFRVLRDSSAPTSLRSSHTEGGGRVPVEISKANSARRAPSGSSPRVSTAPQSHRDADAEESQAEVQREDLEPTRSRPRLSGVSCRCQRDPARRRGNDRRVGCARRRHGRRTACCGGRCPDDDDCNDVGRTSGSCAAGRSFVGEDRRVPDDLAVGVGRLHRRLEGDREGVRCAGLDGDPGPRDRSRALGDEAPGSSVAGRGCRHVGGARRHCVDDRHVRGGDGARVREVSS